MKKRVVSFIIFFLLSINSKAQIVTDIDGNIYNTITIGTQTWMKENLKSTHFNNGISIPTTTSVVAVDTMSLFQWAYNDDSANVNIYGRLYTWFTVVDANNLCPSGWHVPSFGEWQTLGNFLGGDSVAGGKMKETGISHWSFTDSTVNNSSLFTALPGGFRGNQAGFGNNGLYGLFWTCTPFGTISSFQRGECYNLQATHSRLLSSVAVANCGLSVRCVKNASATIKDTGWKNEIRLFPDPTTNNLSVWFENVQTRTFFIYSMDGNLVLQKTVSGALNTFDISKLNSGLYLLRIVDMDNVIESKFVKVW